MRLKDKVAIITGAGTGIGASTARLFAREGARVALVGRRLNLLEEVKAEIQNTSGNAIALGTDVTVDSQVKLMVEQVIGSFGRIDILFNNAGVSSAPLDVVDLSFEEWQRVLDVNLTGAFHCCHYTIPHMVSQGGGSIVNCGSISAHVGHRRDGAYNVAKAGLEMLTKCIALDFAPSNVRCNNVSPAWVETEMNRDNLKRLREEGGEELRQALALHPLGRFGRPEDVAYAVLFLASDEASWITGVSLLVDGGYTSQ